MIPMWKLSGRLGNTMFQFSYLYAKMKDGEIPDVYVQDPSYFENYEKELQQLFGQDIEPVDMVSIHVRRGDYVGNPYYVDLTETGYYRRAMDLFPSESFLVFSDDINFCKEQKIFDGCEFSNGDELTDFNRMAGCKHNIIANSSFSWWAAFVNPHSDKKVVAPKAWYADGVERTKVPDSWIKL